MGWVFARTLDLTRSVGWVFARTLDLTRSVDRVFARTLDLTRAVAGRGRPHSPLWSFAAG